MEQAASAEGLGMPQCPSQPGLPREQAWIPTRATLLLSAFCQERQKLWLEKSELQGEFLAPGH